MMKNFVGVAAFFLVLMALASLSDFFGGADVSIYTAAMGSDGKAWSVVEQKYKVWPSTQHVVAYEGNLVEPLSKCAVWDAKNWTCEDRFGSSVVMQGGRLRIFVQESLTGHSILNAERQVSRLDWWRDNVFGKPVTPSSDSAIYFWIPVPNGPQ